MSIKTFLSLLFLLSGAQAYAISEVSILPGGEVSVRAGESIVVRCEGSNGEAPTRITVCECQYNGNTYGEAVGNSDHVRICRSVHPSARPNNCRVELAPVVCDCAYNGTKYGEVIGHSDTVRLCRELHPSSRPIRCRGF